MAKRGASMRRAGRWALPLFVVGAGGCVNVGGGSDYVQAVFYPSMAQEGEALDACKKKGILTEAEVEQAKKTLEKQRETDKVVWGGQRVFPRQEMSAVRKKVLLVFLLFVPLSGCLGLQFGG